MHSSSFILRVQRIAACFFLAGLASHPSLAGTFHQITCWGDSLTDGVGESSYCDQLEDLTGVQTVNLGVYGQRSGDIAVRMNAYAGKSQQTFAAGFTIPTSGMVTITWGNSHYNPAFLIAAPYSNDPSDRPTHVNDTSGVPTYANYPSGVPIAVTVAGKDYTLNCLNSSATANTANCTPATYPANPVKVPSGAGWTAVVGNWLNSLNLIRVGRNNCMVCSNLPVTVSNCQVAADIDAMGKAASGPGMSYRVLSVQNGDYFPAEYIGHSGYAMILAINAWEAKTYGAPGYKFGASPYYSGNFVDIRANLVAATCSQLDAVDQYACSNDFPGIYVRSTSTWHGQLATGIGSTETAYAYKGAMTTTSRIDSEYIQAASYNSGQVSKALRGFAGSTAAPHASGTPFTLWDDIHESAIGYGLDAAIVRDSAQSILAAKPPAPTGLKATAGAAQVGLVWSAATGATKYNVKRSTVSGSGYAIVSTVTTLSFTDTIATKLVPGTTYYYAVSAVNAAGESANSSPASAKPVFAAPLGLAATAGTAQVSLVWKASLGAAKYNIKRSTVSGSGYATVATVTTLSFTDTTATKLIPGTTYYYVVSGVDAAGESANSAPASAKPVFVAPAGLSATAGLVQVSLAWKPSAGAARYNVKRSKVSGSGFAAIASVTGAAAFTDTAATGLVAGVPYYYVVSAVDAAGETSNSNQATAKPTAQTTGVTVTVDTLSGRHPISPYIYGANFPPSAAYIANGGVTLARWGGNNSSRYNWKLNVTNLDNDWYFENYAWNAGGPAISKDSSTFLSGVAAAGGSPIMTIPMLPWVAKDGSSNSFSVAKYGKQCSTDQWRPDAGDGILTNCSADLTGNDPRDAHVPLNDAPASGDPSGTVYRSQWLQSIASKFGSQPHFYNLDNEPDIWSSTHHDVHPTPTGYDELAEAIVKEGHAIKAYDPSAVRLGPVFCCWWYYWNGADNDDKSAHGGLDFLPWLLNQVLYNDVVKGSRSFDVFDVHAYFNGPGGQATTALTRAAALRETRDWWDSTYVSESGAVNQDWATFTQPDKRVAFVIPRMRALANTIYPGAPVSFTEWNGALAGESDFSTALVDADAYGILGRERMWGATRWVAADPATPAYQALVLYRNADGKRHGFQNVSVSATSTADPSLFSAFAATDEAGDTLTLMVVNKDPAKTVSAGFNIAGFTPSTMTAYTLSSASPTTIVASASKGWSGSLTFAPYSATLIVASGKATHPVAAEWDLNPDTLMANTSGTVTLAPFITSGSGSVTLTSATGAAGLNIALTQPKIFPPQSASPVAAAITIAAPSAPGLYSFSVTGTDSGGATQTQQGWVLATVPSAKLTKTGDGQSATHGSKITLTATFVPGSSGASAGGVDLLFTASAGTLDSRIVRTSGNGNATVTLTLPATPGKVTVTAVGPVFWGTPLATFTETAQ